MARMEFSSKRKFDGKKIGYFILILALDVYIMLSNFILGAIFFVITGYRLINIIRYSRIHYVIDDRALSVSIAKRRHDYVFSDYKGISKIIMIPDTNPQVLIEIELTTQNNLTAKIPLQPLEVADRLYLTELISRALPQTSSSSSHTDQPGQFKFCETCGEKTSPSATFCKNCGSKF